MFVMPKCTSIANYVMQYNTYLNYERRNYNFWSELKGNDKSAGICLRKFSMIVFSRSKAPKTNVREKLGPS